MKYLVMYGGNARDKLLEGVYAEVAKLVVSAKTVAEFECSVKL